MAKKENKKRRFHTTSFSERIKKGKNLFIVYILLRLAIILVMVAQFFNGNYENVFLCVLSLILFTVPSFIEDNYHIDIPNTLEIIVLCFIFAAEILGEIASYYVRYPFWDTALHTTTGFLAAAVGVSLVDILNSNDKIRFDVSPIFMAVVAFCFSMTIAVLWEFIEFGMDYFFGTDMQKDTIIHTINTVALDQTKTNKVVSIKNIGSVVVNGEDLGLGGYLDIGLFDTIKDMAVNFVGAIVFSIIGYFYVKNKGNGRFAKRFIPTKVRTSDEEIALDEGIDSTENNRCIGRKAQKMYQSSISSSPVNDNPRKKKNSRND